MHRITGLADTTGIVASALCLIHCLAMPLLLAWLPAVPWAQDEHVHEILVGVALLAALASLGPGYIAHRRSLVPLLGGAGLACLAAAVFVLGPRFGEGAETPCSVLGALLLSAAHLANRACCHRGPAAPCCENRK